VSTYTVARDDFRNVRRSYVVLGVVGVFAGLTALVFAAEIDIYDDAYRTLYDVSALVAFAFPLFVAALTYLSVAGDRSRGSIKYALGLPNTRLEYFVAKYASRATIAVAAVLSGTLLGFAVAAATFVNGADPVRFLKFGGVSALYALAFTGTFVAISATTSERSRAMFGVIGAYFVLVPFWSGLLPVVSLPTIVDTVASTLDVTLSESTRYLIQSLSPTQSYFGLTEIVYTDVGDGYPVFADIGDEGSEMLADEEWFNALVLLCWATLVPVLGYLKFRASELG
jgi:ABC-2 type transport system permease protein